MNHIKQIQSTLHAHKLDALLLTDPISRRWATGFSSSAGVVLLTAQLSVFITDSRYYEAASKEIRHAEVQVLKSGDTYENHILAFVEKQGLSSLGIETARMTHAAYNRLSEKLKHSATALTPSDQLLLSLRQVKSNFELEKIKQAQKITDAVFADILNIISPKLTEKELETELIYRVYKQGGQGLSFPPIVISGKNSSLPHGKATNAKLSGFLTLDFGAVYDAYCSDMTRTVCIGTPTDEMLEVYEIVQQAQQAGITSAKAGISGKEIDTSARQVIEQKGYGAYFGHGFGHGIGLEVHECMGASLREENPLPHGSVITAEPGIYLPNKFGVRIEDMLYLGKEKTENLTNSPKHLLVF